MPSWFQSFPALADPALFLLRLAIGLMFALSGWFKLTDPDRREKMAKSLRDAGISPALTPLVSAAEFLGGVLLVLGFLTLPAALLLLAITVGALVTTAIPKAEGEGVHKLENVLYAPEVPMAAGLLLLVAVGAGAWGVDGIA
jgi:putative oxidoreductase